MLDITNDFVHVIQPMSKHSTAISGATPTNSSGKITPTNKHNTMKNNNYKYISSCDRWIKLYRRM